MDQDAIGIVAQYTGIGGIAIVAVMLTFRDMIRQNIFPRLSRDQSFKILMLIVILMAIISFVAIGVYAYITASHNESDQNQVARLLIHLREDIETKEYHSGLAVASALSAALDVADRRQRERAVESLAELLPEAAREVEINDRGKRELVQQIVRLIKKFGSNHFESYLSNADLSQIDLVAVDFSKTNLQRVNFDGSFLIHAYFDDANLRLASFVDTRLRYATFHDAVLYDVDFSGSDWFNALGIDVSKLSTKQLTKFTQCPSTIQEFIDFLNDTYLFGFDDLTENTRAVLIEHWNEILEENGPCARINAAK